MRTLVLKGEVGLRDVAELARVLADAVGEGGAAIDVATLTSLDCSVLQLLIAAHRSAGEAGVPLGFTDPLRPALRDALVAVGMVAPDGAPLTPEHDFWTRAISPTPTEAAA